ncbi:MAG TPA: hypothetical protein VH206_00960 [Xanthobacteraceae bacterium]|jgi:hypothetical protein|nr:hypothetical protein [Xanthobacteraceae bacterium]
MFGRKRKSEPPAQAIVPSALQDAMHQARVEAAERTSVVVDLRDAELARLELLNEALDPLFGEIPPEADLFDRGISRGETPRLWIDAVAHVAMGRDKRSYRFLHDSRMGRHVLAESHEIPDIVQAITTYIARRLVERQRALADNPDFAARVAPKEAARIKARRGWRAFGALVLGFILGAVTLFAVALLIATRS